MYASQGSDADNIHLRRRIICKSAIDRFLALVIQEVVLLERVAQSRAVFMVDNTFLLPRLVSTFDRAYALSVCMCAARFGCRLRVAVHLQY